ncbi:MAG: S-layer homology domain-containing protein [Acidimicrobiales bacterium]
MAALAAAAVVVSVLTPTGVPASARELDAGDVRAVRLDLLGSSDLASLGLDGEVKPRGQNGDVATLGDTAFVGGGALFHGAQASSGRICTDYGGVKVVDLSDPAEPALETTITIEDTVGAALRGGEELDNVSVSAGAVDALTVTTPTFSGDVLAIAIQRCEPSFFFGARVEFWDVSNPAASAQLGVFDPATIPNPNCDPAPAPCSPATGQWGIFEDVRMFTRGDRLFALATTPFSIGNAHDASPFGDLRVLDITDLRNPVQVDTFPPVQIGEGSVNGCRTFLAGRAAAPTPDGDGAYVSFYDGSSDFGIETTAVFKLDLDNMPEHVPGTELPPELTPDPPSWGYLPDPDIEGNAADVAPLTGPGGESLVMVSEDDIDPAKTRLSITSPATAAGTFRACENPINQRLFEFPGQQVSGEIAYVGRGCPETSTTPDRYVTDPAGKIALLDRGGSPFFGCSTVEKAQRAAAAGATAVMINYGSEELNSPNNGPTGGIPEIPVMVIPGSAYAEMQYVPNPTLSVGAAGGVFPNTWERTSTTNVRVVPFPGFTTGTGRFESVANADDRVSRGEVNAVSRFEVVPGQSYDAGALLEVASVTAGAFRAAVVWYAADGSAVDESEIASLSAPTAEQRFQQTVVAPAGTATGSVKFEWTGAGAEGTAFAHGFSFVPSGLAGDLTDEEGEWGAQRIIDFSHDPPTEIGTYRSPSSEIWPPPDNGLYGPRLSRIVSDDVAFTTWLSDGLRVLDVSDPGAPRELASFVPPAVADPAPEAGAGLGLQRGQVWPDVTLVTGVDVIETSESSGLVVISDINAGLYVLGYDVERVGTDPLARALTTACPLEQVPTGAFTDVAGNVHEQAINCLAWYEVTMGGPAGLPADQYGPELEVARDQMASFIARTIDHAAPGKLPAAGAGNPFPCPSDPTAALAPDNVHFEAIKRLAAAGVVQGAVGGRPTDCYGPDLLVSRDQMASFINRALTFVSDDELTSGQDFYDDDDGNVHETNINAITAEGIAQGTGGRNYDPDSPVRRDQMASFLARTLDSLVSTNLALTPT